MNATPEVLLQQSRQELKQNNPAAAAQAADTAVKALRKKHAPVYDIALAEAQAADAYFALGKTDEAVRLYKAAIATAEGLSIARKTKETAAITAELIRVGHARKLEHKFMVPALVLNGMMLKEQNMRLDAQHQWEEAIQGGPQAADPGKHKFADALFALADAYEEAGQRQNADKLYKNITAWCQSDQELIDAMVSGSDFHMSMEKYGSKRVLSAVLPAVEKDSAHPSDTTLELWRKMGIIASASDEWELSRSLHSRLLAAYADNPNIQPKDRLNVLEKLAQAEFRLCMWDAAKRHFIQVERMYRERNPPDMTQIAQCEQTISTIDAAIVQAQKKH